MFTILFYVIPCITLFLAVVHSPIGGDFVVEQCSRVLDKQKIEIVPAYKIGSKVCVFFLNYCVRFS